MYVGAWQCCGQLVLITIWTYLTVNQTISTHSLYAHCMLPFGIISERNIDNIDSSNDLHLVSQETALLLGVTKSKV